MSLAYRMHPYKLTANAPLAREAGGSGWNHDESDGHHSRASLGSGFLAEIEETLRREVFAIAQLAPSDCNIQPWVPHVVSGRSAQMLRKSSSPPRLFGARRLPTSRSMERSTALTKRGKTMLQHGSTEPWGSQPRSGRCH